MKHPKLIINIPEPCHEDWNAMTPTQKGKFCKSCTKEVVDFTSESDEAIIKHFQKNTHVCGRFHATQLNRTLITNRKQRNHWLSYVASFLLPAALFSQEIQKETQQSPKTEQATPKNYTSLQIGSKHKKEKTLLKKQNDSLTVSGIVTDDTGLPLPGATVVIKNTSKGVVTDFDGKYSINMKRNDILVVSYLGYVTYEFKVVKNNNDIHLEPSGYLGGIVTVGYVTTSAPWIDYNERPLTQAQKENKKRIANYFAFQKKKWREKREKRHAKRAARKAERAAKRAKS